MEQFTAIEVRQHGNCLDSPEREMLYAFADMLEAREKAEPVAFRYLVQLSAGAFAWSAWLPMDCINNRAFPGDKIEYAYTHPAPSDAERLAEALRDARDTVLAFLGDVAADGSRCGMKQAVIKSMFASLLDRFAAHSAQAQPPAASVTDGFVFERVNMGRGNERYVGLADGSEGTTVQEDGDGPGDTRSRLLWRIADAALAAQENPNG